MTAASEGVLAERCSLASQAAGESLAGSAPSERTWLLVEQAGPWAADALRDGRLAEPLRGAIRAAEEAGARVQLIRGVARSAAGAASPGGAQDRRRVFVATVTAAGCEVRTGTVGAGELTEESVAEVLQGAGLTSYRPQLWLVCTNGRRDRCCAERGRPVAAALAARWPDATWETTHLGGHRFAATVLALPSGLLLGRLDPVTAVAAGELLRSSRFPDPGVVRGRVGRTPVEQAAEVAALELPEWADADPAAVRVVAGGEGDGDTDGEVTVHLHGRSWRTRVRAEPQPPRPLSCGDAVAKPTVSYRVASLAAEG